MEKNGGFSVTDDAACGTKGLTDEDFVEKGVGGGSTQRVAEWSCKGGRRARWIVTRVRLVLLLRENAEERNRNDSERQLS